MNDADFDKLFASLEQQFTAPQQHVMPMPAVPSEGAMSADMARQAATDRLRNAVQPFGGRGYLR